MELETIGRNIKKYRIEKKLRQEDLAEKTECAGNFSRYGSCGCIKTRVRC